MGKPKKPAVSSSDELHDAARSGDILKVVSILSSKPFAVNSRDKHSRTPLHLAAWSGQIDVVNYLCKNKAEVGASAMDDMGAIHFASQKGHLEVVKALVSLGVSTKSFTCKGMTPLHFAAQGSHMELVKYLVKKGANLNAKTKAGKTPLDLAESQDIRTYLEESERHPVRGQLNEENEKSVDPAKVKGTAVEVEADDIIEHKDNFDDDEQSKRKADEDLKESTTRTKKTRVALNHLVAEDDDNQENE